MCTNISLRQKILEMEKLDGLSALIMKIILQLHLIFSQTSDFWA